MYDHWDLTPFYTGIDDAKFASDFARLKELASGIGELAKTCGKIADKELLCRYIALNEECEQKIILLFGYLELRSAVNAKDTEALSYIGRIRAILADCAGAGAVLRNYIGRIDDIKALIGDDKVLTEYAFLFDNIKSDFAHLLSGEEETIMSKYNISGGSAWETMRDDLTASVKVQYNGGVTNLSDIRNKAYEDSAEVRKSAYEAELACYPQIEDAIAYSLNNIKKQATTEAELRHFESPIVKELHYARMQKATLDALLTAMVEYMPHFRRYLKALARALGHKNGLPWYDLFAPVGNDDATYSPEDARNYLAKVFTPFDADLANMVDKAFADNWIDFYPADGKQGGAFCMSCHPLKQSRVLTNFGGKFGDVMTLAHELGHAFHNFNLYSHRPLNTDYSMPVAETASNFNEVLTMDYALSHAETKEQKIALLNGKLSDTTQIICDIYSRYLFEKSVFDACKDDFMTADKLSEMMLAAQKQAYGDGLDPEYMHKYMWICKGHYYSPDLSFYNWPYAFGGLFAQGLFAKYKEMGAEFVPLYKKLLHATTVCSVEDTAKIAGIDLTNPDFWRQGLDYFVGLIDEFEELTK